MKRILCTFAFALLAVGLTDAATVTVPEKTGGAIQAAIDAVKNAFKEIK